MMEAIDWLLLAAIPGLGPTLLNRLAQKFGPGEAIIKASESQLTAVTGITPSLATAIRQARQDEAIARLQREIDRLTALGGQIVLRHQACYPSLLSRITNPPPLLFALGSTEVLQQQAILAIVGTRAASVDGCQVAYRLAFDLARQGWVPVSGLAIGIDSAVHQGALDGGGRTIAVMASGLNLDYPKPNRALKERIRQQGGCLITEACLDTPALATLFPLRNRIISGMSLGVVVVEAPLRSGALITARLALDQGRSVFAVPGPVQDPRSRGVHQLLRDGARLVEGVEDIVAELGWPNGPMVMTNPGSAPTLALPPHAPSSPSHPGLPDDMPDEALPVYQRLQQGSCHQDELLRHCQLTGATLSRILLYLELSGTIERLPGNLFALAAT
ncbi:MAG: DNA-protecting protein DprA [Magnetococcales bacterium]|nr:DNA-protecting protein DprA [Magnetococcales bacterium]